MSAQAVLDKIEQLGLLEKSLIENLRKQVAQLGSKATAEAVVKLLVDKGHLTAFQGNKLLAETRVPEELELAHDTDDSLTLAEEEEEEIAKTPTPAPAPGAKKWKGAPRKQPAAGNDLTPLDESSGLVPLDESAGLVPLDESSGLVPLDDSEGLVPIEDDGGGLTPLASSDPLMEASALEADPFAAEAKRDTAYVPKARRSQWESTLMFMGVGGLVLLLLIGAILYFSLTRGKASEMYQQADEAYKNEQYQDAILKYDQFVASFPDDENASLARVRKGLAQLRSVVKGARDWKVPLSTAQRVLPVIESEEKFPEARDELAAILPQIAEGFATQAQSAGDIAEAEQFVEQAETAMKLVENPSFIPSRLRTSPGIAARIEAIRTTIQTVRRDIARSNDLAAAVESIKQAAEEGNTDVAYETRDKLIKTYPGLATDPALNEAVAAISKKQQELVQLDTTPLEAITDDALAAPDFQIVLAGRSGESAADAEGQFAVIRAQGAVYGIEASTGRVLWRRFIGFDPAPSEVRIGEDTSADVLTVDGAQHELLRLDVRTGKLKWRLKIGEPFTEPVYSEAGIALSTVTGKLFQINPESGAAERRAVLPQSASVPPAVDTRQLVAYQVVDHTNVFVLSLADMKCKGVFHLGHKPGTVLAPPVVLRGFMLLAENLSPQSSRVNVIATGANGTALKKSSTTFDLRGRLVAPPLVNNGRVLMLTDLGAVYVFEVDPANKRSPVTQVSALTSTETQPLATFAVVREGQMFVGDRRLTKYEIQASRGELIRSWLKYEGDEFIAPLQVCGEVVIHARRRAGIPGIALTASAKSDGREVWRASLAAPLAGAAFADAQRRRFVALSSGGQLFEIEQANIAAGYLDAPTADVGAKLSSPPAFASRFDLGDGRLAFASQPPDIRLAVYDPAGRETLRLVTAKLPPDSLACEPVLFHAGLLMPCTDGRIYLIDPATGKELAAPALPPTAPGGKVQWQRPALLPGGEQFVATSDQGQLHLLELQESPEPHLEVVKSAKTEITAASALAVVGEKIVCVARGKRDDSLATFNTSDLAKGEEVELTGRAVWGPEAVGTNVFVSTDRGGLMCLNADCKQVWQSSLKEARPAGAPIAEANRFLVALDNGLVLRLEGASGAELSTFDLAQPLAGAPVPFAGRLLLTGRDGTLYVVSLPESSPAANVPSPPSAPSS